MPKAKVGGINMYYEVHGEGEAVLMLQGGGTPGAFWRLLIPDLAREYKLVIPDNRGAGWTEAPDYPYAFNMMANDSADLLDHLGIESAHIMGASMGGHQAQHFALDHPEKTISLILMCTEATPITPDAVKIAGIAVDGWPQSMKEIGRLVFFTEEFREKNQQMVDDLVTLFIERAGPPRGFLHQYEACIIHNTLERLHEIKAPTLVMDGRHDVVIPIANVMELAKRIPNAELVIFEDSGHLFFYQELERTSKTILDFLRRHPKK